MPSSTSSAAPDGSRSVPRVLFIAAPLMARSGVYRSTHDLVAEARARGLDWRAVLGLRPTARGTVANTPGVREVTVRAHGRAVLDEVADLVSSAPEAHAADVVVTLVTQSDVALARSRGRGSTPWVAWVRGLPWPAPGEQGHLRRVALRLVEGRALREADDVWATTPVLADEVARARRPHLVPAGIRLSARRSWGEAASPLVWAARFDVDKRPAAFVELAARAGVPGRLHGQGPLEARLRASLPEGVTMPGWVDPARLWDDAGLFVGTASREAFGRSAVEAAAAGVPILLGDSYGAAPLLVTDPDLRRRLVLPVGEPDRWLAAVRDLTGDAELRRAVSDHVAGNASLLSVAASVDAVVDRLSELGVTAAAR
ncbi:glycosyltransferase family 4 protein [Frigoribacterium sp. VKM Ac-2836]|uniref:glycosyltransferase family 4 protein n=1 Tax=Frigoribacterium sp. VKM Ac-2836 TaxID=2739014 RepID=UPI001563E34D|nr:glycosyltransferase family 4 protein [Frigoribacterium sp. VKM Ac-2836]